MHLEFAGKDFLLYLEDQGKSEDTVRSYRGDLKQFMNFLRENQLPMLVNEIKASHVTSFMRNLRRQGRSTTTVYRKLNCLRSLFKYLLTQEIIDKSPTNAVEAPKVAETLPVYLTDDEITRLMNTVNLARHYFARRDRALIKLLLTTGIRRCELLRLTWEHVDFKHKILTIRFGKGKKDRIIPLRDEVLKDLWDYLQTRLPLYNKAMFLSRQSGPISKDSVSKIIRRYVQAAGITKHVTAHTLRHSFCTHLINQGVNVAVAQDIMGHDDITTTRKYTHTNDSQRRSAIDMIDFPGITKYSQNPPSANTWEELGNDIIEKGEV